MVDATLRQDHTLADLAERTTALLKRIACEIRPCKACGTMLYFVVHSNGKVAPYTADAMNHFANCPEAAQFHRTKERQ